MTPPTSRRELRAARPTAASQKATAPKRIGHKRGIVAKVITISAMVGAGMLLVATSIPTSGLHIAAANAADAVKLSAPTTDTTKSVKTQNLAVDTGVVEQSPTRDGYTVILPAQKMRVASISSSGFSYTNDVNGTIQWPFPNPVPISSGFGPRVKPCGGCSSVHEGVDFTPGSGAVIDSIADGVVSQVGTTGALGNHVVVDHVIDGVTVQSLYAHMTAGSIKVAVGQHVTVAQPLGIVGSTGESTGTHLHLGIMINGTFVDPFAWLKAHAN